MALTELSKFQKINFFKAAGLGVIFLLISLSMAIAILKTNPVVTLNQRLVGLETTATSQRIVRYLGLKRSDQSIYLTLGRDLSMAEINHLADVKRVLLKFVWLAIIGTLVATGGVFYLIIERPKILKPAADLLMNTHAFAIGTVIMMMLFGGLSFNQFFEILHRVFFAEGTYGFEESSILINLYPANFWQINLIELAVLASLINLTVYLWLRYSRTGD